MVLSGNGFSPGAETPQPSHLVQCLPQSLRQDASCRACHALRERRHGPEPARGRPGEVTHRNPSGPLPCHKSPLDAGPLGYETPGRVGRRVSADRGSNHRSEQGLHSTEGGGRSVRGAGTYHGIRPDGCAPKGARPASAGWFDRRHRDRPGGVHGRHGEAGIPSRRLPTDVIPAPGNGRRCRLTYRCTPAGPAAASGTRHRDLGPGSKGRHPSRVLALRGGPEIDGQGGGHRS